MHLSGSADRFGARVGFGVNCPIDVQKYAAGCRAAAQNFRKLAEAVPSAWASLAVDGFVYQPAEVLSPAGTEPHQLRGLVSGGSLRVG